MINTPLVTVLMSVYNSERFLSEAIESILNQTFEDFEFIIIDDASVDGSLAIIKSYNDKRIVLVEHKENQGLPKGLNEGLRLARGRYVARLDADDVSRPDRLKAQFDFMAKHPGVVVLGSGWNIISELGRKITYQPVAEKLDAGKWILFVSTPFGHPSVMFRKKDALAVSGYNENLRSAQDYDLWSRLRSVGEFANINKPLINYRITSTGISVSKRAKQLDNANKIINVLWQDNNNPMPITSWSKLWPKSIKLKEEKKYFTYLHLDFARRYMINKNTKASFQHIIGAFLISPLYFFLGLSHSILIILGIRQ